MIDETTGKVTFNETEQAELNRIIEDRLARERSKYSDYEDLKGIDQELAAFGYQGTAKERREALKAQREEIAKQAELEELQRQSKTQGTSPELLAEIKELKKELGELKGERNASKQAEEAKKAADEAWSKQVKEMTESYPDVDLDALAEDPKFKKFAKGKGLPLKELYEDFAEFIGETEAQTIARVKSKEERSTSSGKGKGSEGNGHGLTDNQRRLAKENGMTEKEYADLLSQVKR